MQISAVTWPHLCLEEPLIFAVIDDCSCLHLHLEAFNTIPHAWLMQRLEASRVPIDMQSGSYALYESMSGKVQSPNGLVKAVPSTIGVKQGCSLSPTLVVLYLQPGGTTKIFKCLNFYLYGQRSVGKHR